MSTFDFSIIMPIYNVEEFLSEAIDSIINQTIGFENIQLILVNDGSPDNSEEICLAYKKRHPDNVIYIKKENGGVSSARNKGVELAKGKYINFLDPDDYLSQNVLNNVKGFFETTQVDLVAIPMFKFGAEEGEHQLNYKFDEENDKIINIHANWQALQLSGPSSFFRREAIKTESFTEGMKYAEDALFVNQLILSTGEYGALSKKNKYYYRRRLDNSSATQSGQFDKDWYFELIIKYFKPLINLSSKFYEEKIKYVQNLVMYDITWRLNIATEQEFVNNYIEEIIRLISDFDSNVILSQRFLNDHRKLFLYKKLYSKDGVKRYYTNHDVIESFRDWKEIQLSTQKITIDLININNNNLIFEGNFGSLFHKKDVHIFAKNKTGKRYVETDIERAAHDMKMLGIPVKKYKGFLISVPIEEINELKFYAQIGKVATPLQLNLGRYSGMGYFFEQTFRRFPSFILQLKNQVSFDVLSLKETRKLESAVLKSLLSKKRGPTLKAVIARKMFAFKKVTKKKPVWVFMDRQDKADDNAEHLFKYTIKNHPEIDAVFVIDKESKDFKRLKKIGKVIPLGSYQHKLYMLLADKVLSSHIDEWVINPFFTTRIYYQNLIDFDFVFLQHGITKDDMSTWLNRYKKNIDLIIAAGKKEYRSFVEGNYNLAPENVALTGFPRFDNLISKDQKQILIVPTWRKKLVAEKNQVTGIRPYSATFKQSDFFHAYNNLINDEEIISKAQKMGYKIIFFPHPDIQQQISDFNHHEHVEFASYDTPFQKLFNESSLLITDYSSVAFDFAYEKKPLIYYHFDEGNEYEAGYFNYETMGFGPIVETHDSMKKVILECLDNDCVMDKEYTKRVDSFYEYTDNNNCQRVMKAILN